MNEILIIFKTHLDVGFTDSAESIVDYYCDTYIPRAIETAYELRDTHEQFIWTTGSWIISEYLSRKKGLEKQRMERAIEDGLICWHGLPFTTHTELMDENLFRHGISISKELDRCYQKNTIAAKMTDVPGHTVQMVPILAEYGIRFLHIGVNEACCPPEVPPLFRWKSPDGSEIIVMYNSGYGEFTMFADGQKAVWFAHTNDNLGPQSVQEVQELYASLRKEYPEAYIHGGNLDDLAELVLPEKSRLPVVTSEIGDTWIHGTGTDPRKIFCYRQLLQYAKTCNAEEKAGIYKNLILIPEHTWGLDEKIYLSDHDAFRKDDFEKLRKMRKAQKMEASWKEQRDYIDRAVATLPVAKQEKVQMQMRGYKKAVELTDTWERMSDIAEAIENVGWRIRIQGNGAICLLEKDGIQYADKENLLGLASYELFSDDDYNAYIRKYLISTPEWAIEDNKKIGLESAITEHIYELPLCKGVFRKGNQLLIKLQFSERVANSYGCPKIMEYIITCLEDRLVFDVAWYEKQACRCAEAIWFSMEPNCHLLSIQKLGRPVGVNNICSYGNRRMHAVDQFVNYDRVELCLHDSSLVSIGGESLLNFENLLPEELDHPNRLSLNLYNNIWGTNFPMWYDEDARFRFTFRINMEKPG